MAEIGSFGGCCGGLGDLAKSLEVPGGSVVGLLIVVGMSGIAIGAAYVSPHDPYEQEVTARLKPPVWMAGASPTHLLGTDPAGRDILARIIYGSQISLATGAASVVISALIGVVLGLIGGCIYPI